MTVETINSDKMTAAVDYYLENSEINKSGVRVVNKKTFMTALKQHHDLDEGEVKKVQDAIDFETTAAARVAVADLENKISSASKEDLASEDFRKGLTAEVRLPTFGGSTEIEVFAEKHTPVPARGDTEATVKIDHGKIRTKINTKGRIYKDFHEDARERLKTSLGL